MFSFSLTFWAFSVPLACAHTFRTSVERVNKTDTTRVYTTHWYNQTLDHFTFTSQTKFRQKYLINDTFWDRNGGPIFFYTGNEGDIEAFTENSGFMWDIAPEFGALLVFAEHRYYGESLPFGPESRSTDPLKVGYLSSSQALADYVDLITYLKGSIDGAAESPVVAFGGSYGGMLAAWIRTKYPHIVQGAIAASAPIAQFTSPCDAFGRIVTSDFSAAAPNSSCSAAVRASWSALDRLFLLPNSTGLNWLNTNFQLCPTSHMTAAANISTLKSYLTDLWTNLAMMDYPYGTSFLAPLPPNPVAAVCEHLSKPYNNDTELLQLVYKAVNVYSNYTGESKCLNLMEEDGIGADMWSYQACTEMVMPFCYDGSNDMFEPAPWNLEEYTKECQEAWGPAAVPQPDLANSLYGGRNLASASNIVFSNGLLDPWSSGGVLKSSPGGVVAIIIPEGAHHLDLRGSNPSDPVSVIQARKQERAYIDKWIKNSNMGKYRKPKGFRKG